MKTYNIDIVEYDSKFYIYDFTFTRPLIRTATKKVDAMLFAEGYKAGVEMNSYNIFNPNIVVMETTDKDGWFKERKKYYDLLWKSEEKR